MPDAIEFDPVDTIAAGAVGAPGERTFYIQASKGSAVLSVLVEKQQVAALCERVGELLGRVAEDRPEDAAEVEAALRRETPITEPAEPHFRASVIGIGFDPQRDLVVLELYENGPEGEETEEEAAETLGAEGQVARLYATRAQMRTLAARGAESVAAGRPPCPWCSLPLDAEGHVCPATNGKRR